MSKEEKITKEEQPVEVDAKPIEVVGKDDTRNYTIIVEATVETETGDKTTQIINLFAPDPANAYAWVMDLRQLYNQKGVVGVKLVGVYRRTALKVVDDGGNI